MEPKPRRNLVPEPLDAAPRWMCPQHRLGLEERNGELLCPEGERFPIVAGIPRFVPRASYADAFGVQWKRFRRTQLDSHAGISNSRERAERCLGPALAEFPGVHVLEAGCGAGRFTEILLDHGASVTSVDLSEAVEANAENFPPSPRHRVAQADIRKMPFARRQFDVVFCLGVVQHTPDPEATIAALYEHVKPGGWLTFDHYTRDLSVITRFGQVARPIFKRLPPEKKLPYTERMVDRLLPLHKRLARYGRIVSRFSPVLSYYHGHPELSDDLQREWGILDTHDNLTDPS